MSTEMYLLTIRLSGPESETRAGLKPNPALSWFLVMLVTFGVKDLVLHISRAKGAKIVSLTALYCSFQAISYSSLFLSHAIKETMNSFAFFLNESCLLLPSMPRDFDLSGTFKTDPWACRQCDFIVLLFLLFQQVPTASVTIEGASALNRVRWAQAGKEVAVGDSEGRIWVYDVGEVSPFFVVCLFCWGFVFCFKLDSWRLAHPSLRKKSVLFFQWGPH